MGEKGHNCYSQFCFNLLGNNEEFSGIRTGEI